MERVVLVNGTLIRALSLIISYYLVCVDALVCAETTRGHGRWAQVGGGREGVQYGQSPGMVHSPSMGAMEGTHHLCSAGLAFKGEHVWHVDEYPEGGEALTIWYATVALS